MRDTSTCYKDKRFKQG